MTTLSVSNKAQLLSALAGAKPGDTIALAGGDYGKISLDGSKYATKYLKYSGEVTIVSADAGDPAAPKGLSLNAVHNLTFRFKGSPVASGDRTDVEDNLNFDEGDAIVLINYEAGSFKGVRRGNKLDVNSSGTDAKIDSVTDLQELDHASPRLSASISGDTPTLRITQSGGAHDIVLEGLGEEYLDSYDPTLF